MRESLEVLKHISLQGREENFRLTKLAIQSHKDSRMLKALTIVATTYLPGTFLAVRTLLIYLQFSLELTIYRLYLAQT
jgi:hypothetical protein